MVKFIWILLIAVTASCGLKKPDSLFIVSPERNAYWGNHAMRIEGDSCFTDTSYYQDMKLQPYVDPVHFSKNLRFSADLSYLSECRSSSFLASTMTFGEWRKMHRKTRRFETICTQYDVVLHKDDRMFVKSIYIPVDPDFWPMGEFGFQLNLIHELFHVNKKDRSHKDYYGKDCLK